MFADDPFGALPHPLGEWVEWRSEPCRRGRVLLTAVNHRDGRALHLRPEELDPTCPGSFEATVRLLDEHGFTARSTAIPITKQRRSMFVWRSADQFVRRVHSAGGHRLLARPALIAQVVLALAGLAAMVATVRAGPPQLRAQPGQIPAILLLGLAAVMVHEFGHAIVTIHYGRKVRQAGFGLHLGSPAFYVESTDALLLDRRQRINQAVAGPWAEWMFTSCVAIACLFVPRGWFGTALLHRFLVVNTIGILSNLIPFVGLDGALILSDVVHEPDLSFRSRTAWWRSRDRDWFVVSYSMLDALVAVGLLVTAGFFWWELFGQLVVDVWSVPGGNVVIAAVASLVTVRIIRSRCPGLTAVAQEVLDRLHFRLERAWRVRATLTFATLPALAGLDEGQLGAVAGVLERRRIRSKDAVPDCDAAFVGGWRRRRLTYLPSGWQHAVPPPSADRDGVASQGDADQGLQQKTENHPFRPGQAMCESALHILQGDGR